MPLVDRISDPAAVAASSGPLLTLSAPHPPWWQPWVTGHDTAVTTTSRSCGRWPLGRASASAAGVLPSSVSAAAHRAADPTPGWTRGVRRVITTHDPGHGGNPRPVKAPGIAPGPDDLPEVFALSDGVTAIGSVAGNDVWLSGLDPWHAEIHHDDIDEYADHGRPYGGREGGELGQDLPQPPRQELRHEREA